MILYQLRYDHITSDVGLNPRSSWAKWHFLSILTTAEHITANYQQPRDIDSICIKDIMNQDILHCYKAKEKYRGVFEIQKSGDKTSSGEIGLEIGLNARIDISLPISNLAAKYKVCRSQDL